MTAAPEHDALYLGVDGGGTKTEFVCIGADGTTRAQAFTGTTYHLQVGLDEAVRLLDHGVTLICRQLGATPGVFRHAFFGLPAYGEDNAVDPMLHAACGRILGHARYTCGNDMICGWAGSLDCANGINIVAGTGSIGYGERNGRAARIGGWGEIFSDEGSAYWIAIQGLNAFTRMSDGRLPRAALHARLRDTLALRDDLDLCARIMGQSGMSRSEIAGLARIVSHAAEDGDEAAAGILTAAARELATMATALRHQLGFVENEPALLSWSGGVLTSESGVLPTFTRMVADTGAFTLAAPRHRPAIGAALYARHRARNAA